MIDGKKFTQFFYRHDYTAEKIDNISIHGYIDVDANETRVFEQQRA